MTTVQYFEIDGVRYKVLHYKNLRTNEFTSTHIMRLYPESGVWLSLCGYVNYGNPFNTDHKWVPQDTAVTCPTCGARDPRE